MYKVTQGTNDVQMTTVDDRGHAPPQQSYLGRADRGQGHPPGQAWLGEVSAVVLQQAL